VKKHTTYDIPCYVLAPYIIHHLCNPCAQDILCLPMSFFLSTCSYFVAAATGAAAAAAAASAEVAVVIVPMVVVLVVAGAGALAAVAA
jgi:hypothetical protein